MDRSLPWTSSHLNGFTEAIGVHCSITSATSWQQLTSIVMRKNIKRQAYEHNILFWSLWRRYIIIWAVLPVLATHCPRWPGQQGQCVHLNREVKYSFCFGKMFVFLRTAYNLQLLLCWVMRWYFHGLSLTMTLSSSWLAFDTSLWNVRALSELVPDGWLRGKRVGLPSHISATEAKKTPTGTCWTQCFYLVSIYWLNHRTLFELLVLHSQSWFT